MPVSFNHIQSLRSSSLHFLLLVAGVSIDSTGSVVRVIPRTCTISFSMFLPVMMMMLMMMAVTVVMVVVIVVVKVLIVKLMTVKYIRDERKRSLACCSSVVASCFEDNSLSGARAGGRPCRMIGRFRFV